MGEALLDRAKVCFCGRSNVEGHRLGKRRTVGSGACVIAEGVLLEMCKRGGGTGKHREWRWTG